MFKKISARAEVYTRIPPLLSENKDVKPNPLLISRDKSVRENEKITFLYTLFTLFNTPLLHFKKTTIITLFIPLFTTLLSELGEENVELNEKHLLITIWKRRVEKSILARFVAPIMQFLKLCRNQSQ